VQPQRRRLVGTGASLFAAAAELGWFTARSGDLILTMAALHGRKAPTLDERRAWVLAVLIFGSSAREGFTSAAKQLGLELEQPNQRVPLGTLRAINGLSATSCSAATAPRGAIALGTALPLGVGARDRRHRQLQRGQDARPQRRPVLLRCRTPRSRPPPSRPAPATGVDHPLTARRGPRIPPRRVTCDPAHRPRGEGYPRPMAWGDDATDSRLHGTQIAESVIDLIGNTPLVRLKRISEIHGIPSACWR
jgi:hypothetical protein